MSPHAHSHTPPPAPAPLWLNLLRLARPNQWAKGAFVIVGPLYAAATDAGGAHTSRLTSSGLVAVLGAVLSFGFASSACYVFNDLRDVDFDRAHPRKRNRPIASGTVGASTARAWAVTLLALAAASILLALVPDASPRQPARAASWLAVAVGVYILNTSLYSLCFKRIVVLDVISLASGFVLRVMGGCAAAGVTPSSWLLDVTFFVSMFLAFGKRLGERRSLGTAAGGVRAVLTSYTDELLRMAVVVTGVATLITYAGYVQDKGDKHTLGFNLLWLTMLPATYGLLRCIVLLEQGAYDDPTELAAKDRPFQVSVLVFLLLTVSVMLWLTPGKPVF